MVKLLIWGAGAIGGTVGAHMVRAGHDVTFVDIAEDHVAAMNATGLRITGPVDEFTVPAKAFTPATVTGVWDRVFLCTKAHHTKGACAALLPHLAADGYVLSLQNGFNEREIAGIVGAERTIETRGSPIEVPVRKARPVTRAIVRPDRLTGVD